MREAPCGFAIPDVAPSDPTVLFACDNDHTITYLRMLDAEAEGAGWREETQLLLHTEPDREPARGGLTKATSRAPDG